MGCKFVYINILNQSLIHELISFKHFLIFSDVHIFKNPLSNG